MLRFFASLFAVIVTAQAGVSINGTDLPQELAKLQRQGSCDELPRFGVSTHQARNPDYINVRLASEIGARIVRIDIPWIDTEHAGHFEFEKYDNLINRLRENGTSVLLVLAYGHPNHSDGLAENGFPLPPRTPEQRIAYARYAQAVATRYHGPDVAYEIWNEPNLAWFWPPHADAAAYGELLAAASQAIRKVEPVATIISGGLANEGNPPSFLKTFTQAGALEAVGGITFHPYRRDAPEKSIHDIAEFESAAGSDHRPLWITEWGYSDAWGAKVAPETARQRSAVMVARLMLTAAMAKAKALLVYDLIDDGRDPLEQEAGFGLYDYDFKVKPAAGAFRSLAGLMSSCRRYAFTSDPTHSTIVAKFSSTTKTNSVIWTYATHGSSVICYDPLDGARPTKLQDLYDNVLPLDSCGTASGTKLRLSESSGPLILSAETPLAK
jgi:polysaccharide biosynthesis protein PslG